MNINFKRQNHQLKAVPMGKTTIGHLIFIYDVESYVNEQTGEHFPYLLCYKIIQADRDFNVSDVEVGHFLWEDKDKFLDLLVAASKISGARVSAIAHNHHYDLLVNNGEVLHKFTDEDLGELIDDRISDEQRDLHSDSIIDTLTSTKYRLVPFQFSTKKPRFIEVCEEGELKNGAVKYSVTSISFICSMNYFPESLASIGESMGLNKGELNHFIDRRGKADLIAEAIEYCKNDVEILSRAVISFLQKTSAGNKVPKSAPTAVFNMYLRDFVPNLPPIYAHDKERVLEIEYLSYSGARTEVYTQNREEFIYSVDVNSLYPYGMKKYKFPTNVLSYQTSIPRSQKSKMAKTLYDRIKPLEDRGLIVHVTVDVPKSYKISPIPKRLFGKRERDTRLIFPTGEFMTYLTTPEFFLAYELGLIKELHQYVLYEMNDIFSDFVNRMYYERNKAMEGGNMSDSRMYKLFMNSLGGKFGQIYRGKAFVGRSSSKYDVTHFVDEDNQTQVQTFGYSMFEQTELKIARDAVPAIASHINAYGRVRMWELIQKAGQDNIHYIDNDGLKVNEEGFKRLTDEINDTELGKLKLEYTGYLTAHVAKDYIVREAKDSKGNLVKVSKFSEPGIVIRHKGVKENSEKIDSLLEKEVYSQEMFSTPYDVMRNKGMADGYKTRKINISKNLELHGRISTQDGDTLPLHFDKNTKEEDLFKHFIQRVPSDPKKSPDIIEVTKENKDSSKEISTDIFTRD